MTVPCACGSASTLPKTIKPALLQSITAQTKLNDKEVKALYARFRRLAPSGCLLPEQFRQTMGVLGLTDDSFLPDRLFLVFNAAGDGKLSFLEFATSLAVMIRGSEDDKLKLSFEMAAGHRGASGIALADFQRLIHACNRMMAMLVAPTHLTSDEEVNRLFHDLTENEGLTSDGEELITLESYKAAAQGNEDFLRCLGLAPELRPSSRGMSGRESAGARNRGRPGFASPPRQRYGRQLSPEPFPSPSGATSSTAPALSPGGIVFVPGQELEDLQRRLGRVGLLLQKKAQLRSGQVEEQDTQILSADFHPPGEERRRRPSLPQSFASSSAAAELELQDFIKVVDEIKAKASSSFGGRLLRPPRDLTHHGLAGLSPLEAGAPSHAADWRAGFRDEDLSISREDFEFSREFSRETAQLGHSDTETCIVPGERVPNRTETMQAKHRTTRKRRHRLLGPKKGLAVHFGHESWNIVLSMMIGIRMSVGRCQHEMQREVQPVDFIMQEKFTIIPKLANLSESKRLSVTRFIDYAPLVFQKIRASFGVSESDYLRSVGPEQLVGNMVLGNLSSPAEMSSEGKSGAFFYYTADGNFMMKTVTTKEYTLLRQMLKQYHDHIIQNPGTLIVRFLGLHCLRVQKQSSGLQRLLPTAKRELYFVVMANMFNTPFEIHRRYDLKGSWIGRVTPKEKRVPQVALKDVDFQQANETIEVGQDRRASLLAQIERDSKFLSDNNIIDYSLLVGIHEKDGVSHVVSVAPPVSETLLSREHSGGAPSPLSDARGGARGEDLFGGAAHRCDSGGMLSSDLKSLYFMGIIDILTPYDGAKKAEHAIKALRYDRRGVSCCPPAMYAERFSSFMKEAVK